MRTRRPKQCSLTLADEPPCLISNFLRLRASTALCLGTIRYRARLFGLRVLGEPPWALATTSTDSGAAGLMEEHGQAACGSVQDRKDKAIAI